MARAAPRDAALQGGARSWRVGSGATGTNQTLTERHWAEASGPCAFARETTTGRPSQQDVWDHEGQGGALNAPSFQRVTASPNTPWTAHPQTHPYPPAAPARTTFPHPGSSPA